MLKSSMKRKVKKILLKSMGGNNQQVVLEELSCLIIEMQVKAPNLDFLK